MVTRKQGANWQGTHPSPRSARSRPRRACALNVSLPTAPLAMGTYAPSLIPKGIGGTVRLTGFDGKYSHDSFRVAEGGRLVLHLASKERNPAW